LIVIIFLLKHDYGVTLKFTYMIVFIINVQSTTDLEFG